MSWLDILKFQVKYGTECPLKGKDNTEQELSANGFHNGELQFSQLEKEPLSGFSSSYMELQESKGVPELWPSSSCPPPKTAP